jgi:hypothetical protein
MPIARVETPDGRVMRLEVPEGTTPLQVEAFVFEQMNASKPATKPAPAPQDFAQPEKPNALVRLGRGMSDVTQGAKQGALMIKDWFTDGDEAVAYTREKDAENALYERGRGKDAGMDWMRLGGNVVTTLPAAFVPGGAAASLATRMLSGAAGGAGASGVMYTPEGESKAGQIATGAALGAAAPAVVQGVRTGASRMLDRFLPGLRGIDAGSAGRIAGQLEIRLEQQGVNWNNLTQQVKDSLVDDAQRTLTAGGSLDDVMLANRATIEAVGARPTRASVTRAPRDWQTEKNLRGIQGVGDDIVGREQTNAAAMQDYLQRLRSGTGGRTSGALETGESAVTALRTADKAKQNAVSELYDAFRDSGLKDAAVPETKLTEALTKIIDEIGLDNVPTAVQKRLQDFGFLGGKRTRMLTVQEADTFNRLLNANNPGNGPAALTIGRLKGALNESLLETPGGGELLTRAREAAAQRFAEQRASAGITAAIDDVHPDRFVQKFIVGAPARDMKATLKELAKTQGGQQAVRDVKGHVVDSLLMKATGATNLDDVGGRAFSGKRFSDMLDSIEPEKLHSLFSPSEMEALRTLQRASKLLTEEVPFSDVNHSKTTAALANLLQKIGNTPLLGQLASPIIGTAKIGMDWVKDANARKQVAEILVGSAGTAGKRLALPPGRFEYAAPAAAAAAGTSLTQRPDDQRE